MPWPVATDDLDRWVDLVARHPLWELAAADPSRDAVRRASTELVVHLAWVRREGLFPLADDPWQDLGFARRMIDRLAWLVDGLPPDVDLSAAEAGLLLSVPFLYDTLWAGLAGRARGVAPARPHPVAGRLQRPGRVRTVRAELRRSRTGAPWPRSARGQLDAAEEIGWWLLHRWIGRQPAAYQPESLADLLEPVAEPGSPTRAATLSLRAGPADRSCSGRCGPTRASWPVPTGPTRCVDRPPTASASDWSATCWSTARGAGAWRRPRCPR